MSAILQQVNRPVEWAAGLISLDTEPIVMAQFDRFTRWNGFLCPSFDALTVVNIIDALNKAYGDDSPMYGMEVEWVDGALVLTENTWVNEAKEFGHEYEPERIEPDADGLYSLGAYGWVWTEWSEYAGDLEAGERFTVDGETWLVCVANRREAGIVARIEESDEPLVTLDQDDVVCTVTYAKGLVSA